MYSHYVTTQEEDFLIDFDEVQDWSDDEEEIARLAEAAFFRLSTAVAGGKPSLKSRFITTLLLFPLARKCSSSSSQVIHTATHRQHISSRSGCPRDRYC